MTAGGRQAGAGRRDASGGGGRESAGRGDAKSGGRDAGPGGRAAGTTGPDGRTGGPDAGHGGREVAGRIRVLIADDQKLVRAGLVALLGAQADLQVVGEAADGAEAVTLARELAPDVVLMDIRMPVMDGLEATRRIAGGRSGGSPRVVVLTTYDLDEYVYDALHAGASGFLLKHALPEELLLGVRSAANGGALVSPAMTRPLIEAFTGRGRAPARAPAALGRLTRREREIFDLVAAGRTNVEISRSLAIAETTVKTHLGHVLEKLALRDRVHVVVYAYEHRLVEPGGSART